ncbi:MAG TPA: 4-(cytidine 5'-diphospho)-2-C-methyl-D-erythritol kinase [Verrucomicrobiae bacterium]
MQVELKSPCKVNLILNILGKRPDGFHELETVMHPVAIHDVLTFERMAVGLELTCDNSELPTDASNLVHRAATAFLQEAGIKEGVRIHLQKRIPLEAGLGGGSGNAATTLLGMNKIFGEPLEPAALQRIAATLGSDVPFFLQSAPAMGLGRGEQVTALLPFPALKGCYFVLIHPGFGVSTPWAYKNLARFPEALNGERGRAERLVRSLTVSLQEGRGDFYNSLEAPVLEKYPILKMFQEFLLENGAAVALMSGSGSTTFAVVEDAARADRIEEAFRSKFGESAWTACVPAQGSGEL